MLVLEVVSDVLGRTDVTAESNFFQAGGDSLAVLTVTAQMQELLDQEIPLELLFECETLGAFAESLSGLTTAAAPTGGSTGGREPDR